MTDEKWQQSDQSGEEKGSLINIKNSLRSVSEHNI